MASYESFEETTVRKVYTLKSPTNWAEVGKVTAMINQELEAIEEGKSRWDDVVTVEAWDDKIRFSYIKSKEKK